MSHFRHPSYLQNFVYIPLNLSQQGASFKHPHDSFLRDDFKEKVRRLVKTGIWFILRKLAFFVFFSSSNETLKNPPPLNSTRKMFLAFFIIIISQRLDKTVSSFSGKCEKPSKSWLFEVTLMGSKEF